MKTYRITKYNPSKRNEQGHYLDNNEWTSISDLKNLDEYFKVESAYVNAILTILQHFKISRLYAVFIEKHTKTECFLFSCWKIKKTLMFTFQMKKVVFEWFKQSGSKDLGDVLLFQKN
mgnify:CR=1 FL=1